MNDFVTLAFSALTKAKRQFGEYSYHDKGASEVMELQPLLKQLRAMAPEAAGQALIDLEKREDTGILVRDLISDLDDWDEFFEHPANEDLIGRNY